MTKLLDCHDENGRHWIVTARLFMGEQIFDFVCWRSNGSGKTLDQTAGWRSDGWDLLRWFPRSPAPVPEAILSAVERQLKELVRQQEGVGRG